MNSITLSSHQAFSRQQGLSLVELMVSVTISIFILLAATTMFATTKQATRAQEANARLLENGRAATEILSRSIRMARYFGCAGVDSTSVTNHFDSSTPAQSPTTLNGYNQQGIFGINAATDEIIVYRALDTDAASLAADIDLGSGDPVTLPTGALNPAAGDMIAITDCTQGDVFNTTGRSTATGIDSYTYTTCPTCSHSYQANATVHRVERERFHIATGQGGRNALFVEDPMDPNDVPQELIEGVENMQITYGIDTDDPPDGVANQYVAPATVLADCTTNGNATCWRKVTSARLALLLATVENNVVTTNQQYTFNGSSITAADRRLRREFLKVIALRNYRP